MSVLYVLGMLAQPSAARTESEGMLAGPVPFPSSCSPTLPIFHITPPPAPSLDCPDDLNRSVYSDDFDPGSSSAECSVDYDHAFPRPPVLEVVRVGGEPNQSAPPPLLTGFPSMDKISDCDSELANLLKDVHTPPEEEDIEVEDDDDRSPVIRCGSCGSLSATSDDEDVGALDRKSPAPLRFRSSPPRGVHRLNKRTISPKVFLASTVSSRFHRHRFANTGLIQRPHLDFEKMQVTRNTRILYSVM